MILGIDPGLQGALMWLAEGIDGAYVDWCADMPTHELVRNGKKKREIDIAGLLELLDGYLKPTHAFVENVGPMPGQGVSGVFAFGKCVGIIHCALHARGIPFTLIAPQVWKKALAVPAAKDGARMRASQLLPNGDVRWKRAKDHGRAQTDQSSRTTGSVLSQVISPIRQQAGAKRREPTPAKPASGSAVATAVEGGRPSTAVASP